MATPPVAEPVARIRGLNDAFRRGFSGGRVVMSAGVAALLVRATPYLVT